MIAQILRKLWIILNRDRIPPLPRGMLATFYDELPLAERRALARLGARDPIGVHVAMKRHGVNTVEELVEVLEHFTPKRRLQRRILQMLGRLTGGTEYHPHREAMIKDAIYSRRKESVKEVEERVKRIERIMR